MMVRPLGVREQLERRIFAALGEAQALADHPLTVEEIEAVIQREVAALAEVVEEGRALYGV